jgi:RNA-binding protein YhbY
MQVILASILSCAALLVGVLATPDWKPYTSPEGGFSVSLPDDAQTNMIVTELGSERLFTHIVSANDQDLNEYMVSWTDYRRNLEAKASDKTFDRMRDALIRHKEGKLLTETASLLPGKKGRAFAFSDNAGHTVNVRFYFVGQRAYQVLAESRTKADLAKAEKFFASFKISEVVKREVQKALEDSELVERADMRAAQREMQREIAREACDKTVSDNDVVETRDSQGSEHSESTEGFSRPQKR